MKTEVKPNIVTFIEPEVILWLTGGDTPKLSWENLSGVDRTGFVEYLWCSDIPEMLDTHGNHSMQMVEAIS